MAGRLPNAERFRGSRPASQATPRARPRLVALSATTETGVALVPTATGALRAAPPQGWLAQLSKSRPCGGFVPTELAAPASAAH